MLAFSRKKAARMLHKVLESAIANAEHNHGADIDELKVATIHVDGAPFFARYHAARERPRRPHLEAQQPHHGSRRRRVADMGQKVNPIGIRLGITQRVVVEVVREFADCSRRYLEQDHRIREFLQKKLKEASVSRIHIERPAKKANITIHTARPGVVIGKKGEDIEKLRSEVAKLLSMPLHDVRLNIAEIRKPELDALLVAEGIAQQLERRVQFRRAMRRRSRTRCALARRASRCACRAA